MSDKPPLHELLRFRLDQAHDSLREAEILQTADAHRGAINRAYYAMFYALSALLATRQLGTSKHSGAIGYFDKEFVKTGVFPPELSRALHMAFEQRQIHDYGEMMTTDGSSSVTTITSARQFVAEIENYLQRQGMT
jgi:hypothetical protein